jgi:hypothetical protein
MSFCSEVPAPLPPVDAGIAGDCGRWHVYPYRDIMYVMKRLSEGDLERSLPVPATETVALCNMVMSPQSCNNIT